MSAIESMTKDERRAGAALLRITATRITSLTWWQHGCAVDARGIPCPVLDARAARFDARGHLLRALADEGATQHTADAVAFEARLERAILETVNDARDTDYVLLHHWNDAPKMCPWKVRKALRTTARRLEGRAADTCKVCGEVGIVASFGWCPACLAEYHDERAEEGPALEW